MHDVKSYLGRYQQPRAATGDELLAMRKAAWHRQGVIVLRPEDVQDEWIRQALVSEAARLFGRRREGGR
jgi:hypothetical protein